MKMAQIDIIGDEAAYLGANEGKKSTGKAVARQWHKGYTILELLIASGIMFVLVTLLLSAWSSSTDFAFMVNENLRRMEAVDRIRATLHDDFNNSAALDQYSPTAKVAVTKPESDGGGTVTLFPQILQEGREIRYVRMRSSITATNDPSTEERYRESFSRTNVQALSQFNDAPVSPHFIISPDAETPGAWAVSPVWESNLSGLSFDQNANPEFLRIYRIVLIPYSNVVQGTMPFVSEFSLSNFPLYPEAGPGIRRGMLLRQFSNTNLVKVPNPNDVVKARVWQTIGLPLSDAVILGNSDVDHADYMFTSNFDGVSRVYTEVIRDNEIRMKLSLGMQMQQLNATVVTQDLRLSFPFRRISHGQ
jgi:type II secretory pathway pseudopilin PulG